MQKLHENAINPQQLSTKLNYLLEENKLLKERVRDLEEIIKLNRNACERSQKLSTIASIPGVPDEKARLFKEINENLARENAQLCEKVEKLLKDREFFNDKVRNFFENNEISRISGVSQPAGRERIPTPRERDKERLQRGNQQFIAKTRGERKETQGNSGRRPVQSQEYRRSRGEIAAFPQRNREFEGISRENLEEMRQFGHTSAGTRQT